MDSPLAVMAALILIMIVVFTLFLASTTSVEDSKRRATKDIIFPENIDSVSILIIEYSDQAIYEILEAFDSRRIDFKINLSRNIRDAKDSLQKKEYDLIICAGIFVSFTDDFSGTIIDFIIENELQSEAIVLMNCDSPIPCRRAKEIGFDGALQKKMGHVFTLANHIETGRQYL